MVKKLALFLIFGFLYVATFNISLSLLDRKLPLYDVSISTVAIESFMDSFNVYLKFNIKNDRFCDFEAFRFLYSVNSNYVLRLGNFENADVSNEELNKDREVAVLLNITKQIPNGIYRYETRINYYCNSFQRLFGMPIQYTFPLIYFRKLDNELIQIPIPRVEFLP